MSDYVDVKYTGIGDLHLYARDYRHDKPKAHLLCLHGLTRNSADFEPLVAHLRSDYHLIVPDQRGRGRSEYDSHPERYSPLVYVQDMFLLLDFLEVEQVLIIGTSMGGLMGMFMAAMQPHRITGLVLNDICPEVLPEGLQRIQRYVGKSPAVNNWHEAIALTKQQNTQGGMQLSDAQWAAIARRLYRENAEGIPVLAYDPAIAELFEQEQSSAEPPDLWPVFKQILELPILVLRGAYSDILAPEAIEKMVSMKPDLAVAEIPQRGHAPFLDEPLSLVAIDHFLASVE